MGDAKDILGLSSKPALANGPAIGQEKKGRGSGAKKPEGVSREVYALIGGVPPIMPTIEGVGGKGRSKLQLKGPTNERKAIWRWQGFTTSARADDLQLHHWVRSLEGDPAQPSGDYAFAKYNKPVEMVGYSDEEYQQLLQSPKWSKDETDHLFDLCGRFDLRFVVIADRFSFEGGGRYPERSVEELKERYYGVARIVLSARARSGAPLLPQSHAVLLREAYNARHETERKKALSLQLGQSRRQEREEAEVLAEAKRIMDERKQAISEPPVPSLLPGSGAPGFSFRASARGGARGAAARPVGRPSAAANAAAAAAAAAAVAAAGATSAAAASAGGNATGPAAAAAASAVVAAEPSAVGAVLAAAQAAGGMMVAPVGRPPRVYVRGVRLAQTVEKAQSNVGVKTAKKVEHTLEELGVRAKPRVPTRAVCAEYIALRKEVIALLNFEKAMAAKQHAAEAARQQLQLLQQQFPYIPPAPIPPRPSLAAPPPPLQEKQPHDLAGEAGPSTLLQQQQQQLSQEEQQQLPDPQSVPLSNDPLQLGQELAATVDDLLLVPGIGEGDAGVQQANVQATGGDARRSSEMRSDPLEQGGVGREDDGGASASRLIDPPAMGTLPVDEALPVGGQLLLEKPSGGLDAAPPIPPGEGDEGEDTNSIAMAPNQAEATPMEGVEKVATLPSSGSQAGRRR